MLDFHCTNFTYDGHNGIDTPLRSFAEQAIGVPVFAVLDGIVTEAHDGEPDMVTQPSGQPANYVITDDGYGRGAWYWHMKNGSIAVQVGDFVKAGQQLGLVASSGNSTGPHLHFNSMYLNQAVESFAGPCRPGPSGWENQPALNVTTYLQDFGVTTVDLGSVPCLPTPLPAGGQIPTSHPYINIWAMVVDLPGNSTWRTVWRRPNGTTAYDSGNLNVGIPTYTHAGSFWFGQWNVADMHSITGTWYVDLILNGVVRAHAPIEIVSSYNASFNRTPEPITVVLDPPAPKLDQAVFCRVNTSVIDDADYDVVRYHYVWKSGTTVIRDVVTAGQADAIPHHSVPAGTQVSCEVTPSDGTVNGGTVSASAVVTYNPSIGDLDGDGDVDLFDYAIFQSVFTGP